MLNHWLVVISGSKLIDEVRKLPEDQASLSHALDEVSSLVSLLNICTIIYLPYFYSSSNYITASEMVSCLSRCILK